MIDERLMMSQGGTSPNHAKQLRGKKIACTADFGVQQTTNMAKPGDADRGKPRELLKSETLLRATVVFAHEIDEMLKPHGK